MSVIRRGIAGCTGAILACTAAAALGAGPAPPRAREVLPDTVVPRHYDVALAPDAAALTFKGKVGITVAVATPTSSITLNAAGLEFDHATLDGGADAQVTLDRRRGRASLTFPAAVAAGEHHLAIAYHGRIGQATVGFFAMDYVSDAGPRRTLATNFEPAEARTLLPCWDEPARKATFTVTVDVPKDLSALSNMPIAEIAPLSASLKRVRFMQSPRMSTYLLFIGIGDFERVHERVDGVDLGIVVKRGDGAKAAYALEQAGQLLRYYNEYFGLHYPLPKLDLIAAPGEIAGGSMENWGAIFYSQEELLFDPVSSTERDRQLVFLVVSHEMAHQWFGDLVTMSWWDELWLNEGFARWMQTYAADDLHPQWHTGLQAEQIYERGKRADSVPSTHPVVQEVDTAEQAAESFDDITYNKGAAVITMLNAYIGRERFREGVRRYMRAHAYGTTVDADLWRVMQQAARLPILEIERDFTRQEGLPLVSASRDAQGVRLATSRFSDDPASLAQAPSRQWRLPLAVAPLEGPGRYLLLHGVTHIARVAPVLINAGQLGYVRVRYDPELMAALTAHLGALAPADQLGLINDAWALAVSRAAPVAELMALARALPAQADPVVWKRLLEVLAELDRRYADDARRVAFRRWLFQILDPLTPRLATQDAAAEPNEETLRAQVEELRGRLGDRAVLARARARLEGAGGTAAERRAALQIVALQADTAAFDALLQRARHPSDPLEKLYLYRALAGVSDPALARRMADIALGKEVPAGSGPELLELLSIAHADLLWQVVAPRLDESDLPLSRQQRWDAAADIAAASADPRRIADLEAYEAKNVPPEARKPFLASVAQIRRNQRFAEQILPELDQWLSSRQGAAPPAP